MGRPRKAWSKIVEAHGIRVRIYEREPGGVLQRSVVLDGVKDRASLRHRDRVLAEEQARELAKELADQRINGPTAGPISFGALRRAYERHQGPLLSEKRRAYVAGVLGLLEAFLGASFPVGDFDQTRLDEYVAARQRGRVKPDDRRARDTVQAGTIRNELQVFSAACNWACNRREHGRRLLDFNPVRGLKLPQEANPRRPVAGKGRYQALAAVADRVDSGGRFALMLDLAWYTGRRINAICHLRASDILLTPEAVRAALAADGQDENAVQAPAIRWRAEWDKKGYLTFSPLPTAVRPRLESYLKRNGIIGEGWIFPGKKAGEPLSKLMAGYYLTRAEGFANVPHQTRGGWHAFRRGWATARKSFPVQDVMAAGGWRDPKALQAAYQHADPATVRAVVELDETGT